MGGTVERILMALALSAATALAVPPSILAGEAGGSSRQDLGQEVDVALVLAVDVSGSIDYEEAELQRKGIAEAFSSREVIQAIQSGSRGQIGVSVVYFSSRQYGVMGVPVNWMIVRDQASAQRFVAQFLGAQRQRGIGTSIADALEVSQRMLGAVPYRSTRQVIDISGDGVNNAGRSVLEVREEVLAKGITINALPIIDFSTPQDLDHYFQACVVGGPAAFVLAAKGFTDFARAMRRKLVLEISGLAPEEGLRLESLLLKAAAAAQPQPAPARLQIPSRATNVPPYPGGCNFPLYGSGFGFR
jgi:hypothetical protein